MASTFTGRFLKVNFIDFSNWLPTGFYRYPVRLNESQMIFGDNLGRLAANQVCGSVRDHVALQSQPIQVKSTSCSAETFFHSTPSCPQCPLSCPIRLQIRP